MAGTARGRWCWPPGLFIHYPRGVDFLPRAVPSATSCQARCQPLSQTEGLQGCSHLEHWLGERRETSSSIA